MIITRTPFRVSLFGGGSDYPAWYMRHGGTVIGFAIDKYCYISARELPPFFEHRHRIVYSVIENIKTNNDIRHPAVRAVFNEMDIKTGLEVHYDADLPARSGLGSSSAFTVGLLNTLSALEGRRLSSSSLATEAIRIEQKVIGEHVGSQDQIWAAYGGCNRIDFHRDGRFDVMPLVMSPQRGRLLEEHCMLVYSGLSRIASDMVRDQIAVLDAKSDILRRMVELAKRAETILCDQGCDIKDIGRMLDEAWRLKRSLTDRVSTPEIDAIYETARAAGALGGKLLGAGGGGFILLFVPPERKAQVRRQLGALISADIRISYQGSRVIVYEPGGFSHAEHQHAVRPDVMAALEDADDENETESEVPVTATA